jgi:predicted RNase H-like nuclease
VPPESPVLRPVERELHHRYGRYHAGPFPGGAGSRIMQGRSRSVAAALADAAGPYVVDPTDHVSAHRAIEVFPAPTWIELFGLADRIAYKKGPRAVRIAALASLHTLLLSLTTADPPLRARAVDRISELTLRARTARDWKAVEDITDARLCAYVAQLWGRKLDPDWIVTGNGTWQDGYVIVPSIRASGPADAASS